LRTSENPETGEQRYEVDSDDPLAPISTEGEDYSVTVASTVDVVSLNLPPSDDLTPTLSWDFEEIDEDDISEIHVFVSTFEDGEGLFPWDEVVDISDNSVLPNLSSSETRDLLTRDWNGYDDFNPGRILTATWRDGQWYGYDGSTPLDTPPNTATQLTLPDDRQLTAGQTYHWGVEAISRSGEVETETQVLQTYSSLDDSTPFSSVSILTHGFSLLPGQYGIPQSFYKMADKIANVTTGADSAGLILRYDKKTGHWIPIDSSGNHRFDLAGNLRPSDEGYLTALKEGITEAFLDDPDRPKPLVLLPEWSTESESIIPDTGFTEGAADAIFASLVELDRLLGGSAQYDPEQGKFIREQGAVFDSPLHFIGFSRGTVVNSEIVQRLGTYYPDAGVREEGDGDLQMTTIDPHDFKQDSLNFPATGFGDFQEPEVRVWDNITFADNYYQTVADEQGATLTPNGRSLGNVDESQDINILTPDGADLNYRLNNLSGFKPDDRVGGPHLKALSWYAGTVDLALEELQLPSQLDRVPLPRTEPIYDRRGDSDLPEILGDDFSGSSVRPWYSSLDGNTSEEGTGHGWFYSVLGGGQGRRPGWSEYPDFLRRRQASVKDDNTAQSYMKGDFAVPTLFNGNFDVAIVDESNLISRDPWFSNAIPGWSFHNGELSDFSATIDNLVERSDIPNLNSFDRSGTQPDFALHLNPSQNNSITHNRFLIPDSGSLHLDVFVPELKVETEEERNRLLLQTGNYIDISLDVDGQQYNLNSIAEPFVQEPNDTRDFSQPIEVTANTDVAVDLRPSYLETNVGEETGVYRVQENLNRVDYGAIGFETFVADVPREVRGKPGLLTIEVKGNKSVYLDDIFFSSKHTQSGIPTLDDFDPRKEAIGHENNYLIEKPQYVVSYNSEAQNANWVSYQLNQSWLGLQSVIRGSFVPDLTLPDQFAPHPHESDYIDSWTKGHLTAASDRTRSKKDYFSTFILSNINPQLSYMNSEPWEEFETYLKEQQAKKGKDVHIITGSYGEQKRISSKEIRVPAYFWKVALILKQPGFNLSEIQAKDIENVIAVRMSNKRFEVGQTPVVFNWKERTETIEFIEAETNLNLFGQLPNQLAKELKEYKVAFDSNGNPISFS
jgi:DNA/RNA endonuclease G (NUC1)